MIQIKPYLLWCIYGFVPDHFLTKTEVFGETSTPEWQSGHIDICNTSLESRQKSRSTASIAVLKSRARAKFPYSSPHPFQFKSPANHQHRDQ